MQPSRSTALGRVLLIKRLLNSLLTLYEERFHNVLEEEVLALLVAFTVADISFKRLYGGHMKRANKRCGAYSFLFSNMNTNFKKLRIRNW